MEEIIVTDIITYDDYLLLTDIIGDISLKLHEITTLLHLALVIAIFIFISIIIYNVLKSFFY